MEDFNLGVGGIGVPLSLSSIGRKYVKQIWKEKNYTGYQLLNFTNLFSWRCNIYDNSERVKCYKIYRILLPYYIANYKGGRNECFLYGIDRMTKWDDYDLTTASSTVRAMAGHPDYDKYKRITVSELNKLSFY